MPLTQIGKLSLPGFRPAVVAPWIRALASRLLDSRRPDDTLAATYLSTRKWSDQTERGLHAALERHRHSPGRIEDNP